jgi:hypothetical protein
VIALAAALLAAGGLNLRDVQERARANDPRVQQAVAQAQNAQAKHDEVASWFPSVTATGFIGGPTPEHYLKGGAFDPNPSDPSHLKTLGYFDGQLGVVMHADVQVLLPVYTFGKWEAGKGASRALVGAMEALLQRARDQAAFDAARTGATRPRATRATPCRRCATA